MKKGKIVIIIIIMIVIIVLLNMAFTTSSQKPLPNHVRCEDGSLVPPECALLCGRDSLQQCIQRVNQSPNQYPSDSTKQWLQKQEQFNLKLIDNPTLENCELARKNIEKIQQTVYFLDENDPNRKIYVDGIDMYKKSIQDYC